MKRRWAGEHVRHPFDEFPPLGSIPLQVVSVCVSNVAFALRLGHPSTSSFGLIIP